MRLAALGLLIALPGCALIKKSRSNSKTATKKSSSKRSTAKRAKLADCQGRMASKPPECKHLEGAYLGIKRLVDAELESKVAQWWSAICEGPLCHPADGVVIHRPGWRYKRHKISGQITKRYLHATIFYRVGSECWLLDYRAPAQDALGGGTFTETFTSAGFGGVGNRHFDCDKLRKAYNL